MPTVRIRLTGSEDDARSLVNAIHALYGIEHVAEIDVDGALPHIDGAGSAGPGDGNEARLHNIEVDTPRPRVARHVRNIADLVGVGRGVPIEIVDEF